MDLDESFYLPHCSPTRPLQLRKQPSQLVATQSNTKLNDNNPFKFEAQPKQVLHPPRFSSIIKSDASKKSHNRQESNNSTQSTISSHRRRSITSADTSGHISSSATVHSKVPSTKEQSLANSSGLIGDFVPVPSTKMAAPPRASDEKGEFQYE
jgi:hypothetical protein